MSPKQRTTSKSGSIDKEKERRFKNQIKSFESDVSEVKQGEENPLEVLQRIETALSNIDETITTLQTRRESVEKKRGQREKKYGKKDLKNIKKQDFHDLKWAEYTEELREIEAEIADWRGYQIEIQDLAIEMLEFKTENLMKDQVDAKAAKRYVDVVEDKLDDISDMMDSRINDQKDLIENKIEAETGKQKAETEAKLAGVEKDVEYLERNVFSVLEAITETLQEVAQQSNGTPQVQEKVERTREQTQDLQDRLDKETRAEKTREDVGSKPERIETEHGEKNPEEEGYPVKEKDEENSEEQDKPRYIFERRAYSELKSNFEKIQREFEDGEIYSGEDSLSFEKVAELSDLGEDDIRNKLEVVHDHFPDEEGSICPALSN